MTLVWLQTAPVPADPLAGINTPLIEYVQVMLVLAGVLAIAYVTLRFGLPRFFGLRGSARGPIETVARYRLEPKKTLYLVKVGSQMFLIGTSEGQVEYLTGVAAENAALGITANAILPGLVASEGVLSMPQEIIDAWLERIPAGRMVEPAEIAEAVAYFASPAAGATTGQELVIDGGQTLNSLSVTRSVVRSRPAT